MRCCPTEILFATVTLAAPLSGVAGAQSEVPARARLVGVGEPAWAFFGEAVSVSGDTALVGAPQAEAGGQTAGAAHVFERVDGRAERWVHAARLEASNGANGDRFGIAVAIDGDVAVVGIGGDGNPGGAYVFEHNAGGPGAWGETKRLVAADGALYFGAAVAVSGETVLVGAFGDNDNGNYAGSVYAFERDAGGPGQWGQADWITPADPGAYDRFGLSVAIAGDTAVAGAPQDDDLGLNSGSAYVFQRVGGSWTQVAKLVPADLAAGYRFGGSVGVAADAVVVGAALTAAPGGASGAAYVFARDAGGPGSWGQVARLLAPNGAAADYFGTSVSIAGDQAVVSAPGHDNLRGGVWAFVRDEGGVGAWGVAGEFAVPSSTPARLRRAVAVAGGTAVVAANQGALADPWTEAVLVFRVGGAKTPYCFGDGSGAACPCANPGAEGRGCANRSLAAGCRLDAAGNASVVSDGVVLAATGSTPGELGVFFRGEEAVGGGAGVAFGDGLRCAGGRVLRLELAAADAAGSASSTVAIAPRAGLAPGDVRRYQWWYRDPVGSPCGSGFNLSNGVEIAWRP